MKYCTKCGSEMQDVAEFCSKCGTRVNCGTPPSSGNLLSQLSERVKLNGIIWLIIGIIQIVLGMEWGWGLLLVGGLNIASSIQDINYSKTVLTSPQGIVEHFRPLTGPVIVLVYNLIFGGVIGVAGSVYYLVGVRNFVLSNEKIFMTYNEK